MIRKWIEKIVDALLEEKTKKLLNGIEVDPEKSYVFVLPENISPEESRDAFEAIRGKVNFLVIHTDKLTILEV